MRDYLSLGSTPTAETCVGIGADDYYPRMRRETRAYINQLRRLFPGLDFRVKGFPHEIGTYHEVCVFFDESQIEEAYRCENNLPERWDAEALAILDPLSEQLARDLAAGPTSRY